MNPLNLLKGAKLSITQWFAVSAAAVIGFLVMALKLQGSRLHRAKVDLLKQQVDSQTAVDDVKVATAREKFEKALKDYTDNGGTL